MKISPFLKLFLLLTVGTLLLVACDPKPSPSPLPTGDNVVEVIETEPVIGAEPTATATETAPSVLNVCIASEPESLYRYDGKNALVKQSIFAALYGRHNGEDLLAMVPSHENDETFNNESVMPEQGMNVLAADGMVQVLKPGLAVFGSESTEVIAWEADRPMTQSTIIYRLNPGLLWSDGTPLSAHDVLYTYHLLRRLNLPANQWALDRTANLEALDDSTIRWTGIPGYMAADLMAFFWKPIPAHLFESMPDEQIAGDPMAARTPLGWGAWRITNWQAGTQISFEKNPNLFSASGKQAHFNHLNFLIVPDIEQALAKLERGECHILDKSYQLEALDDARLTDLASKYHLVLEDYKAVEQLVFGIGSNSAYSREDFFGDVRTRHAIRACINEPAMVSGLFEKAWMQARVPDGIEPSQFSSNTGHNAHELLSEIGWTLDGVSDGVRIARGVANVADGSAFRVRLLSGQGAQSQAIVRNVVDRLAACGIAVSHESMPSNQLYAPGPDGALFGRQFDLAIINWGHLAQQDCELYVSGQSPHSGNYWIGTNVAGLNDSGFDSACARGKASAKEAMLHYTPAVPLMPQIRLWLASKELDLPEKAQFELISDIKLSHP